MKLFNIDKSRMEWIQCLETDDPDAMKRILVRIHHSTHPPYRLKILPATKVSHVLAYLNLNEDYVLSPTDEPTKTFIPEEDLYGLIANDDKLVAKLSPQAVEKYAHTFLP